MDIRSDSLLERIDRSELLLCRALNAVSGRHSVRRLFCAISRLGDGAFWYALIALLPLMYGPAGVAPALQMIVNGAAGVCVYSLIKRYAARERPCHRACHYQLRGNPARSLQFPIRSYAACSLVYTADDYALPGMDLAAGRICRAGCAVARYSWLHYPSDVAAGALLGATLAAASRAVYVALET